MIREILRWKTTGLSSIDEYIQMILDDDQITGLTGEDLLSLLSMSEDDELSNDLILSENIWPTREYFIFYKIHIDSSYTSTIFQTSADTQDSFEIRTAGDDGHFPAQCAEFIIFTIE